MTDPRRINLTLSDANSGTSAEVAGTMNADGSVTVVVPPMTTITDVSLAPCGRRDDDCTRAERCDDCLPFGESQ